MVRKKPIRGAPYGAPRRLIASKLGLVGAALAALALAAVSPVSAHARPRAERPSIENVSDMGSDFRDSIVHRSVSLRSRSSPGYGGEYPAGDSTVSVSMSPRFKPDDAVLRYWAQFLGALVHGPELKRVHLYLASDSELAGLCGVDAYGCYYPDAERIVVPGTSRPDGTSVEAIATHEYGHHVAANRDNSPWEAYETGPKYWATTMDICRRTRAGQVFPGDESANYELNSGEGWAEVYRELNEEGSWDGIVSNFFRPNAGELLRAREDVVHPYESGHYSPWAGKFKKRRSGLQEHTLAIENDGLVDIRLRAQGGLDNDLSLYSGKRLLKRARAHGRSERLTYRACGYRTLRLEVRRHRGYGTYSVKDFVPDDAPSMAARRQPAFAYAPTPG